MLERLLSIGKTVLKFALMGVAVCYLVITFAVLFTLPSALVGMQQRIDAELLQIYEAQASTYNAVLQADAKNTALVMHLDKSLTTKEAAVAEVVTKVAQDSLDRDNKLITIIAERTRRPDYSELKKFTVMIIEQSNDDPTKGSLGTGVILKITEDSTFILTNKHVCSGETTSHCYVLDVDSKVEYPVTIVKRSSTEHDMQVVKVSGKIPNKGTVKGIKDVEHQDRVFIVGHYLGNSFFYSEGVVAGFSRKDGDLVVAAPAGPGNSGSGIITQDGYLTGLLYAGNVVGEFPFMTLDLTHSLCVNSKVLRLFLAEYVQ